MFYCDGTRHLSLLIKQIRLCFIVMVLDMCSAAHKRSGRTGITTQFPSGGSWVLALMFYCDGTKHLSLLIKQIRLCFIVMVLDIFPRLIKEVALLTLLHNFRLVVHGFWLLCFIVMVLDIFPCSWNKWFFRLCFIVMVLDIFPRLIKQVGSWVSGSYVLLWWY
jgi:hypothetical protein